MQIAVLSLSRCDVASGSQHENDWPYLGARWLCFQQRFPQLNGATEPSPMGHSLVNIKLWLKTGKSAHTQERTFGQNEPQDNMVTKTGKVTFRKSFGIELISGHVSIKDNSLKIEMISSQHKSCLGSWHIDELQTVNLSHLCCMFKRCWVMLIPAGCWTSTLVSWRPADLFILGVFASRFRRHGKRVTKELITCVRSVVPERVCRVLVVSLSVLHSQWLFCGVHTEQRLSCILCGSQPPLQMSAMVVEGVFILSGG